MLSAGKKFAEGLILLDILQDVDQDVPEITGPKSNPPRHSAIASVTNINMARPSVEISLPVHQDEWRYGYIRNICLTESDIGVHVIHRIPPNRINQNNMGGLARDHLVDSQGMGNPQGIPQLAQSWRCRGCRPCVVRRHCHIKSQGQIGNPGAYVDRLGGCM